MPAPFTDLLYVSTYTAASPDPAAPARREGIFLYRFDFETGTMVATGSLDVGPNPSFFVFTPDRSRLYVVNELDAYDGQVGGSVRAYTVDRENGALTLLNIQPTHGGAPCYVSLDATGQAAFVANYFGGSVATYGIAPDGRLGAPSLITHSGHGPNPDRQEHAHAHCALTDPTNTRLFVADLGIDQVKIYALDAATATLRPNTPDAVHVAPGAGPRHIIFHPNGRFAYLINELDSTVTAYATDAATGALRSLQTVSTLPPGFSGENTAAHLEIAPGGQFLYASNRGHDSIACFALDPASGGLTALGAVPTGGRTPRFFTIDPTGRWLLAAHQSSDSVITFRVDTGTGALSRAGEPVQVPMPVCLRFARR